MRILLKRQLLHYLRLMGKVCYRTINGVLGQKIVRKNIEKTVNFLDFIGSLLRYVHRAGRNYSVKKMGKCPVCGKTAQIYGIKWIVDLRNETSTSAQAKGCPAWDSLSPTSRTRIIACHTMV